MIVVSYVEWSQNPANAKQKTSKIRIHRIHRIHRVHMYPSKNLLGGLAHSILTFVPNPFSGMHPNDVLTYAESFRAKLEKKGGAPPPPPPRACGQGSMAVICRRSRGLLLWRGRPSWMLSACAIVEVGQCQTDTVVTSHGLQSGTGGSPADRVIDSEVRTARLPPD